MSCCYTEKILCPQKYLAWGAIHFYFVQKKDNMDIIWEVLLHNTQAHACMVLLQFKVSLYCSAFYHVLSMWQHCLANKRRPFTCQKCSQHFFSIQPPSMHFFFIHPKRCNFSLIPSMRVLMKSSNPKNPPKNPHHI